MTDMVKTLRDEIERIGGEFVKTTHGGKHPRLYFRHDGKERFYVYPSSSSDRRAVLNAVSDIRRMCGVRANAKPSQRRKKVHRKPTPVRLETPEALTPGRDPMAALAGLHDRLTLRDGLTPFEVGIIDRIEGRIAEAERRIRGLI